MKELPYDLSISNLDETIDGRIAPALRASHDSYCSHYGYEFCARIKFDPKTREFVSEVMRYRVVVGLIAHEDLERVVELTCARWGWE